MTRKPVPPPPIAPMRGVAAPIQARPARSYPPPPVPPLRGRAPAAQAKPAALPGTTPPRPNPWRHGAGARPVIQRSAAVVENKSTEASQGTYLTALNGTNMQPLCENLASSGGAHSEDLLIDKVLPIAAAAGKLVAGEDNHLFVSINRSPCTSTDHQGNGSPSCNKGGGKLGCAERLIALVTHGFADPSTKTTYPIKLTLEVRNLYGSTAEEQANSSAAIAVMIKTGRISCGQHRTASTERFMGTAAAKQMDE